MKASRKNRDDFAEQDRLIIDFLNDPPIPQAFIQQADGRLCSPAYSASVDRLLQLIVGSDAGERANTFRERLWLDDAPLDVYALNGFRDYLGKMVETVIAARQGLGDKTQVQNDLDSLFVGCQFRFDFASGEFVAVVVEDLPAQNSGLPDLRKLMAPAVAAFLRRNVAHLGRCGHSGCEAFFVGKRTTKTLCDRHAKARAQETYRERNREELRLKAKEYRHRSAAMPLVRRKRN